MSTATELLRRAEGLILVTNEGLKLKDEIRTFLAAEPEAEPVAWWFVYSDGSVADGQSYESEDDCVEAWAYEIESGLGKPEPFFRHPSRPDQEEDDESIAEVMVFPLRGDERERRVDIKWKGQPVAGPLYTRPEPARKPMTEEEINRELPFECSGIYFDGFRDGIAVAEKHYGIGGSDE